MKQSYFSLKEIALMSLCGALIFVLKTMVKIPLHIPGHSGIFWVIPLIVGVAIVRKPGSGIYIGLVSGILSSFFGIGALHIFDLFKYLSMGIMIDVLGLVFAYRFDNSVVSIVSGACANAAKMIVNYTVQLLLGVQPFFILLSIGLTTVSHIVFGALGGLIAAWLIRRMMRAGVLDV